MRKLLQRLVLAGVLVWTACHAQAQTDADTATALVRACGLWAQAESIAPQVRNGFLQGMVRGKAKLSRREAERLVQAIDQSYAPARIRAVVVARLQVALRTEHVDALRSWYASDLGRAITQLEVAADAGSDPQELVRRGTTDFASLSAERRALIEELVRATQAGEAMTQMTIATTLAVVDGIAGAGSAHAGPPLAALRAELDRQRPVMLAMFSGMARAMFATIYGELTMEDLVQYVNFMKSDAGRHFTEVGQKAFMDAMQETSSDFGRRIPLAGDRSNT